ncbi:MAG: hypothetical protein JJU22_10605 [Gammaproteobacteria bacterium]|nr:hypothetical protein [Gammaproteobacteria bacterium]
MNTKDVIWLSMMASCISTVALMAYLGAIDIGANGFSAAEFVVLVVSVVLVGVLMRRFIAENFDEDGNWVGSLFRRRKGRDERR